jgi:ATP-binding cassette, subfamily B, heavy metal transporter
MLKVYKTFYSFLFAYKWRFIAFAIALLAFGISSSIQPYFYKLFIDTITSQNQDALLGILITFISVRLFQILLDIIMTSLGDSVIIPAARDARVAIFKKIHDLDFAFHTSKSTGSLISAMKRGDSAFISTHDNLNIDLARIVINFFVILAFFFTLRLEISFIILISFICNFILAYILIRYNMKKRSEFNDAEDEISAIIVDNLTNFETVKLFAKEQWERNRLWVSFQKWSKSLWGFANTFRLIDVTVGSLGNIGLFLVLYYCIGLINSSQLTPGQFILVLGFVMDFYPKFYQLVFRFRDIAKYYTDLTTYFAILDNEILIRDPAKAVKKDSVRGEIEFKNISFTYPESKRKSLDGFNLHIRSGQSVALVGRSGVGKTTITKLLMRLYDSQSGEIIIDGTNIKKFKKSQLRAFMGVVPQEPVLFNNTIAFNIGYGADNATEDQILAAAKLANLDDFIDTLPKKYETNVGERGVKLSGGQKQRLAIARMILSDPDIIIFDEATSHLDSESEKKIQDSFWKAAKDKTTIIIAHRLATVVKADKIVVLKDGKVFESGSHRDLINRKDSLYSHFWKLQSQGIDLDSIE